MNSLEPAFGRVRRSDSHYWGFWRPDKVEPDKKASVEIRLNVPDGEEADIGGIDGWVIAHRKTGMLFLRRIQVLNQTAIEGLFWDVLKLAIDNGWQFHSWCHEPDLTDWPADAG